MAKRKASKTWIFSSRSNPGGKPYTTTLWDDGTYSCDCKGWCVKRKGRARNCSHINGVRVSEAVNAGRPSVQVTVNIPLPKPTAGDPVGKRRVILED